jgi:hypothetical protein
MIPSIMTSALKETVGISEMLASTNQFTRRLNPEEHHQYTVMFSEVQMYTLDFVWCSIYYSFKFRPSGALGTGTADRSPKLTLFVSLFVLS